MAFRYSLLSAISLACGVTPAAAQQVTRAVLEMSADGEVQIAPDGHVSDYRLHSELAPAVRALVDTAVRGWQFEPILVEGQPVFAKTEMHLALHAEPVGAGDDFRLRIIDVHFGGPRRVDRAPPPRYPSEAVAHGVGAKVLLALRLDDKGDVVDAQLYQTSLDSRASSENEAQRYRQLFEQASLVAARHWHFDLSESFNGKPLGTSLMVPIVYSLKGDGAREVHEGQWSAYVPGPVHPAPWLKPQVAENRAFDTLKDGEAIALDSRFRLKQDVAGKLL